MLSHKDRKTLMGTDIVHQHYPAWRHRQSRLVHLEHRVPGRVQTVVNEHLHVADLCQQRGKTLPARAFQV
jgi:hypothetical protein